MSSREIEEEEELLKIEPWGEARSDYRTALIVHALSNQWTTEGPSLQEVMKLFSWDESEAQELMTVEEAVEYLGGWTRSRNRGVMQSQTSGR